MRCTVAFALFCVAAPALAQPSGTAAQSSSEATSSAADHGPAVAVLTKEAAPQLEAAFGSAGPEVALQYARLDRDHVDAEVCALRPTRSCHRLRLANPAAGCAGTVAGPWCVVWQGPPPAIAERIRAALALPQPSPWRSPQTPPRKPDAPLAAAWTVALFVPVGVGLVIGGLARLVRRRRVAGTAAAVAFVLVPPLISTAIGFATLRFAMGDHVVGGAIAAMCAAAVAHVAFARLATWLLGAVVLAAGLGVLELACRLVLPPPPTFPPLDELSVALPEHALRTAELRLHAQSAQAICAALAQGLERIPQSRLQLPNDARPRVLHVGDSMTYGSHVPQADTFVAHLAAGSPHQAHLNAGMPGSSLDAQALVIGDLVRRLRPARVVLHIFRGNDLDEVDRAMPCCGDGPLFESSAAEPTPRCPPFQWVRPAGTPAWYVAHSPPPLVLRLATPFSQLARHTAAMWVRGAQAVGGDRPLPAGEALTRYERLLRRVARDLRAAGVELVVALPPVRGELGSQAPRQNWALDVATRVGLPVLDAGPRFAALREAQGEAGLFVDDPPGDGHLGRLGHSVYAALLQAFVPP